MLLERGDDLLVAGALLSDAREGQGSLLLVEGPAGIGKSALIGALRGRALGEGCLVLSARGAERRPVVRSHGQPKRYRQR